MSVTATGYAVANLTNLKAIGTADRPASGSNLYYKLFVFAEGRDYFFDPDATTGGITPDSGTGRWFPSTPPMLHNAKQLYVRTNGNDNNTGETNTAGGAFLTIPKAISVAATYIANAQEITINVADGTYNINAPINLRGVTNYSGIELIGNTATPANVILAGNTAEGVIQAGNVNESSKGWYIDGFTINNAAGHGIVVDNQSQLTIGRLTYGTCTATHMTVMGASTMIDREAALAISVTGGATNHLKVSGCSTVELWNRTYTMTGNPNFSDAFVSAEYSSFLGMYTSTFTGTTTGTRFKSTTNSLVYSNGSAPAAYYPGDVNGTPAAATYGLYQ